MMAELGLPGAEGPVTRAMLKEGGESVGLNLGLAENRAHKGDRHLLRWSRVTPSYFLSSTGNNLLLGLTCPRDLQGQRPTASGFQTVPTMVSGQRVATDLLCLAHT